MRVLFLGNHTVGVTALKSISANADVVGVVAHPYCLEDGIDYLSVYDYAAQMGWNTIRTTTKDCYLEKFVKESKPDLIWVTDYRYILPLSIINIASLGAINLHPSLLPKYRGRASINWAILNGERELGLTAHFIDEGMDSGDIIEQVKFTIDETQDIGDALNLLYPIYEQLTDQVIKYFLSGKVPRYSQNHNEATTFPRRKPNDGLINWNQSTQNVRDLVRAVAKPYPGAFSFCRGQKILIWSVAICPENDYRGMAGQVLYSNQNDFAVGTGDGAIVVKYAELDESRQNIVLTIGEKLG